MKRIMYAAVVFAVFGTGNALAGPITWTIDGTFDDEGIYSGSFVYDAETGIYSNIMIDTFGSMTNNYYVPGAGVFGAGDEFGFDVFASAVATGTNFFQFFVLEPLTNAGGHIMIDYASELTCSIDCDVIGDPHRIGLNGSVRSVPEPSTLALIAFGLAVLGLKRRALQRRMRAP